MFEQLDRSAFPHSHSTRDPHSVIYSQRDDEGTESRDIFTIKYHKNGLVYLHYNSQVFYTMPVWFIDIFKSLGQAFGWFVHHWETRNNIMWQIVFKLLHKLEVVRKLCSCPWQVITSYRYKTVWARNYEIDPWVTEICKSIHQALRNIHHFMEMY